MSEELIIKGYHSEKDSVIDMIRIATYVNTIPAAVEMINYCADMGYETTINIMAVSTAQESELDLALDLLSKSKADVIYLVDSYGSLYPEQIRRYADKYIKVAEAAGKKVGIHAHNNQQLAFANTIEACAFGVSYLDATMSGMGRGAGNCYMELLLGFLRNPKYSLNPVLKFIENRILPLKNQVLYGDVMCSTCLPASRTSIQELPLHLQLIREKTILHFISQCLTGNN